MLCACEYLQDLSINEVQGVEKRVREASALRELFDEQWGYLRSLIKKHEIARRREKENEESISEAVETIIEGTGSRIGGAERYRRRLRSSARGLLHYINELISRLPAAIEVSQTSIQTNPLVKVLFKDCDGMRNLFCQNSDVQSLLDSRAPKGHPEIYALLQLSGSWGQLMAGEVEPRNGRPAGRENYIDFHGHTLIAPQISEDGVRKALQKILFEYIVNYLSEYMQLIRDGKLDEALHKSLPVDCKGIENPATYLDILEWILSMPRDLIRLQSNMLEIDSKGIRLPADMEYTNRQLWLNELEIGNNPPKVLTIVRYPTEEIFID